MTLEAVRAISVLVVDDDGGDVRLMREALELSGVTNEIAVVKDGVEAMAFLRREAPYEDAARPDLILLDLNLPRKDGREVLAEVKTDESLRTIPIVVLTTSTAAADIRRSYELHANLYVTKPVDLSSFLRVVQEIDQFFVTVVRLPPRGTGA